MVNQEHCPLQYLLFEAGDISNAELGPVECCDTVSVSG